MASSSDNSRAAPIVPETNQQRQGAFVRAPMARKEAVMANAPKEDLGDRYGRDDQLRPPPEPGKPPRPATEPKGSEGSTRNPETLTDPSTGQPDRKGR